MRMRYLTVFAFSSILLGALPGLLLGDLEVWGKTLLYKQPDGILFIILTISLGLYVAVVTYSKENEGCKECNLGKASAGIVGFILGACPACIPFLSAFLPLGLVVGLSAYSWVFSALGIAIMMFLLYNRREYLWRVLK